MLTPEDKQNRLDISRKLLDRFHKEGKTFLQQIITCDETGAFHYEPETKQQSMEWKHTSSPARTTGKVMMTVFWVMKGHITVDFLEKGTKNE